MILYFSGTGNSKYVAQVIQSITGDELISLNDLIKEGKKVSLHSDSPLVIAAPTYAWRLPVIVDQFLRNTEFTGNKKAYFLLTCGVNTHNATHYAQKICGYKHFQFMGFASIIMPENYIALYSAPEKKEADEIIAKALPGIKKLGNLIKEEQVLPAETIHLSDKLITKTINPLFYKTCVSAKGFYSTTDCISCNKCAAVCPLNNIELVDGKPVWGKSCTHCMACICQCPKEAIEYKKNSVGKPRFFNSGYKPGSL